MSSDSCSSKSSGVMSTCAKNAQASSNLGQCGQVTNMECFQRVVLKCNTELLRSSDLVNAVRSKRVYPHTGFYQENWGALNQLNYRVVDTLKSVHSMNSRLSPETLKAIYRANIRFQMAVQNTVLTANLLAGALNEFIQRVKEYEQLLLNTPEVVAERTTNADENGVSSSGSVSIVLGSDSNSGEVERQLPEKIRSKLIEVQRNMAILQSFLNQLPAQSMLIELENHMMEIYDNYDDSTIVHHLLSDPAVLSMLNSGGETLPPMVHDWNALTSEELIQRRFQEIGNNMRDRRGGGASTRETRRM